MGSPHNKQDEKKRAKRASYQRPAIVYEGVITTRAGSPVGGPEGDTGAADPADLFGG